MANNNNQSIKDLKEALLEKLPSTRVREQELLCHHTTFKIGGPADLFIEPTTMDELSFTLRTIHELQVPVTIIGCGSNILVKDGGIRGSVYSDIYKQLKREFGCVATYKSIKRKYLADVHEFIDTYLLPIALAEVVHDTNM